MDGLSYLMRSWQVVLLAPIALPWHASSRACACLLWGICTSQQKRVYWYKFSYDGSAREATIHTPLETMGDHHDVPAVRRGGTHGAPSLHLLSLILRPGAPPGGLSNVGRK